MALVKNLVGGKARFGDVVDLGREQSTIIKIEDAEVNTLIVVKSESDHDFFTPSLPVGAEFNVRWCMFSGNTDLVNAGLIGSCESKKHGDLLHDFYFRGKKINIGISRHSEGKWRIVSHTSLPNQIYGWPNVVFELKK